MPLDEPIERLRYLTVQIVPYLRSGCTSQRPATEAKEAVVASILRFVKKEQSDLEGLFSVLRTAHQCGLTPEEIEDYQSKVIDIMMSERSSSSSIPLVTAPAIVIPSFEVLKPFSSQSFRAPVPTREMTDHIFCISHTGCLKKWGVIETPPGGSGVPGFEKPDAIILDGSGSDQTGLIGPRGSADIKETQADGARESKQVSWGLNTVHEIPNRREINEDFIAREREEKKLSVLSLLRESCGRERSMDPRFTSASIQFLAYAQAELAARYAYNTIKSNFNILKDIGVNPEIIQNIFSDAWEVMNGLKSFDTITVVHSPALRTTGTLLTRLTTLFKGLQFLQSAPISAKLSAYLVERVNNEDDKEVEHILNIAEYAGCPSNDIANMFLDAYNALKPKTI